LGIGNKRESGKIRETSKSLQKQPEVGKPSLAQEEIKDAKCSVLAPRSTLKVNKTLWYTVGTAHEFLNRLKLMETFPGQEIRPPQKLSLFDRSPYRTF
jgi:hypothetical protein